MAIFAHPDDNPWQVHQLATYATKQQRSPLVIHPEFMPWLCYDNGTLRPVASDTCRTLLGMVARHSGGRLWVVLRPDETREPWPRWLLGTVREWQHHAGRMPSRIRACTWDDWKLPADAVLTAKTVAS